MSTDDDDGHECEPYSQPQSSVFCGCSLVNENWCNWWEKWTENQNLFLSASLSVFCMELCMGDHHTGATEGNEEFVSVFHIIQQAFCDSLALVNDIRLLKLSCHSQPVCEACGSARWLCLFWDHLQSLYYPQCSFVFAAAADRLRCAEIPFLSEDYCHITYPNVVDYTVFCKGYLDEGRLLPDMFLLFWQHTFKLDQPLFFISLKCWGLSIALQKFRVQVSIFTACKSKFFSQGHSGGADFCKVVLQDVYWGYRKAEKSYPTPRHHVSASKHPIPCAKHDPVHCNDPTTSWLMLFSFYVCVMIEWLHNTKAMH